MKKLPRKLDETLLSTALDDAHIALYDPRVHALVSKDRTQCFTMTFVGGFWVIKNKHTHQIEGRISSKEDALNHIERLQTAYEQRLAEPRPTHDS